MSYLKNLLNAIIGKTTGEPDQPSASSAAHSHPIAEVKTAAKPVRTDIPEHVTAPSTGDPIANAVKIIRNINAEKPDSDYIGYGPRRTNLYRSRTRNRQRMMADK
ncbi:hypothetical protein [Paraburkholderia bryophila]|uniref:Uncharacterized protein n=1 Tax=Paraburkholderia bryophila TaxID=420952 RepID=A0A7Y9WME4_9BURK|nr:hypothetical protein [Paraburkholderia bryophila]NYH22463.1 hypothetical protein [Paraburkholderia bryophila]